MAAPAEASISQCTNGQACVWKDSSYFGHFRGMTGTADDYNTIFWDDSVPWDQFITRTSVSSVRNQGNSCWVRFYDNINQGGAYIYFKRVADGGGYQDPYLTNGGGFGPYASSNWNDTIASHGWFNCV
jgi:hypothetical protein